MTRKEYRTNEIAWRNGIKPTRIQPPQQRARTLYERAHDKARQALREFGHEIAPRRNGGAA